MAGRLEKLVSMQRAPKYYRMQSNVCAVATEGAQAATVYAAASASLCLQALNGKEAGAYRADECP